MASQRSAFLSVVLGVVSSVVAWPAMGQESVQAEVWALSPALSSLAADGWLREAVRREKAEDWVSAVAAWRRAGALSADLMGISELRAVELELASKRPVSATSVAFLREQALPGAWRAVVQASEGTPAWAQDVVQGLSSSDRDAICADVRAKAPQADDVVRQAFFAECTLPDELDWAKSGDFSPSTSSLLRRAARLNGMVRFRTANETLDRLPQELSATEACEREFLKGQVVFRLRRRDEAFEHWRRATEKCSGVDAEVHVRALYAYGKRAFDTGKLDEAQAAFSDLVKTYTDRTHADDGWLYLARVARERGDREAEQAALEAVLTRYRDGDMLFEVVWEAVEADYRAGAYRAFLDRLAGMDLPEHDDQYYSQGRLEYFSGRAHEKLGDLDAARGAFERAWKKYPFSFYGYLSHEVMVARGWEPAALAMVAAEPGWLDSARWRFSASNRLLRAGALDQAAAVSSQFGAGAEELWRRSYALDRASRYPESHNIVRRRIAGVPWLVDGAVNEVQMRVAWPNPFGDLVRAACEAEASQAGVVRLHPAFPTAIMREESSFIEDIESYAGALGLMQLMPRTALAHDDDVDGEATPERLKTADVNVRVGVDHIYALARRFEGHPALMAAAYNAGSGAVSKWMRAQPNDDIALFVEDIPPLQTRDYTKRVVGSYAAYLYLSGEKLDAKILGPAR